MIPFIPGYAQGWSSPHPCLSALLSALLLRESPNPILKSLPSAAAPSRQGSHSQIRSLPLSGHFSLLISLLASYILPLISSLLARSCQPSIEVHPNGKCQGLSRVFVSSGGTRAVSGQSLKLQGSDFIVSFVPSPVPALQPPWHVAGMILGSESSSTHAPATRSRP